ncbi:MAG: hypothetical protein HN611_26515, partial [Gemmatimonadetes bacterium]|nr:hypothetical protein [Gemmatimonadota bacterium]
PLGPDSAERGGVSYRVGIRSQKTGPYHTIVFDLMDPQRGLPSRPLRRALDEHPPPLQLISLLGAYHSEQQNRRNYHSPPHQ